MPTPRDGRRTPAPCTHTKRAPAPTHLLSFFGNSSYHIYGGAIAANNATGNAGIVGFATGSTTYKFASVFARVTLGKGVLAGDAFYNTLPNNTQNQYLIGFTKPIRTGDYSAACIDPATKEFWGASEQGQMCARGRGVRVRNGAGRREIWRGAKGFVRRPAFVPRESGQPPARHPPPASPCTSFSYSTTSLNNWGTIIWRATLG